GLCSHSSHRSCHLPLIPRPIFPFLRLHRHINGYVVVLWDGLPSHRSAKVMKFIAQHEDRLAAFRLPAYCPDFNSVEWLWADLKWNRMKGFCPANINDLKNKLSNNVRALRDKPDKLASFYRASLLPLLVEYE
ncbi:MAG: transposase, partial [Nitrososphaerota archaeon]|nr:transposase [Nitrososphaerota archaeon]